ncbi:MAG TPA: hypothetical protein VM346_07390 [Sphingomicrobium sp.]|nr:hypothetical protein [Sphingomicrobium sp.]
MAEKQAQARGLQVNEDRHWQETLWTAQRFAWAAMALLVVLAMLGATGKGGPLATASVKSTGATIEYPRITRWQSADQLSVRLPANASGEVQIELSQPFVELFSIESVEPEPSRMEASGQGHRFAFNVSGGGGQPLIVFHIKASRFAFSRTVTARVGEAAPVEMSLIILP